MDEYAEVLRLCHENQATYETSYNEVNGILEAIKQRIYNIIRDDVEYNLANSIFAVTIIFLIVINILVVIFETFNGLPLVVGTIFYYIEVVCLVVFTVEYLLRIWTATCKYPDKSGFRARFKYVFSFMAIIDLLAIAPFYLPFIFPINLVALRAFRLLRLLRLAKLIRYTTAMTSIGNVISRKSAQLVSSMLVVLLLMVISSIIVYKIERHAQPDVFENAFSGLWLATATLTTVGYGDIYPVTVFGRLLSTVIALLGIGLVAVPTGIISAGFIEDIAEEKEAEARHYCSYCGKKID